MTTRRDFLQLGLTGGGLLLLGLQRADAQTPVTAAAAAPDVSLYVRIDADNRILIRTPRSEMGQGVRTSLAMLVAEELEADWRTVSVATLPLDARAGDQGTGGSNSVAACFEPLRRIGASLRETLRAAAAQRWNLPLDECIARDSHVTHAASSRSLRYADLLEAAAKLSPPAAPALKPRRAWRLLGTAQRGKDCADIVHGRAGYGIDVRLPGQLFAQIERAPRPGAVLIAHDAEAALAVPGVRQIVVLKPGPAQTPGGVAVVATTTWAAAQGRARLAPRWDESAAADDDDTVLTARATAALAAAPAEVVNRIGDPDARLATSERVIAADYQVPFLAHATMEPQNATAHWHAGRLTLWLPSQFPGSAARAASQALGIAPEQVTVNLTLLGGGFGRRINNDYAVEAALVAQAVAAPVQVVWTREDDFRHDYYRPLAAHRLEACLDADGWPQALRHRMASTTIGGTYDRSGERRFGGEEAEGIGDTFYRVPERSSGHTPLAARLRRGWWRAVHTTHTTFAMESFIDELAAAAGRDPLAYRLALIDRIPVENPRQNKEHPFDPARMRACLQKAAQQAGWSTPAPPGRARGLACAIDHRSYAALVLEIARDGERLVVHRATCAVDCGQVINPDGARAQVEGSIVQGLSAALGEAVTLRQGRVQESNFHQYALLRLAQAPLRIDTHFLENEAHALTGLGEPALPVVAPALANALARLTTVRQRTLPLRNRAAPSTGAGS